MHSVMAVGVVPAFPSHGRGTSRWPSRRGVVHGRGPRCAGSGHASDSWPLEVRLFEVAGEGPAEHNPSNDRWLAHVHRHDTSGWLPEWAPFSAGGVPNDRRIPRRSTSGKHHFPNIQFPVVHGGSPRGWITGVGGDTGQDAPEEATADGDAAAGPRADVRAVELEQVREQLQAARGELATARASNRAAGTGRRRRCGRPRRRCRHPAAQPATGRGAAPAQSDARPSTSCSRCTAEPRRPASPVNSRRQSDEPRAPLRFMRTPGR